MVFRKLVLLIVISFVLIGCENVNSKETTIKKLTRKNDSLSQILNSLNKKFIFDSIAIRDIPSYQNTYEKNSYVKGEIVIVGFNYNDNTNIILSDSISYSPEIEIKNPDTLKLVNGGFNYNKLLIDSLSLNGIIQLENIHGRKYRGLYNSLVRAKE